MSSYDNDLNPILEKASNDELKQIIDVLLKKFSNAIDTDDRYKKNPDNPKLYTDLIADEIRLMGGNSFVNMFRGEGVSYHEVVSDVASKLKVEYDKNLNTEDIEEEIIKKVWEETWNSISVEEREKIVSEIAPERFSGGLSLVSAQAIFRIGGFTSYKIAVIVANTVAKAILGRGLTIAANVTLTKTLSILVGPIGWAISGLWTAIDIAGPAYKATIPCVIFVAMIRMRLKSE